MKENKQKTNLKKNMSALGHRTHGDKIELEKTST